MKVLNLGTLGYLAAPELLTPRNVAILADQAHRLGYDAGQIGVPIDGRVYQLLVLAQPDETSRDEAPRHFIGAPQLPPRRRLYGSTQDMVRPFTEVSCGLEPAANALNS